MSRSAMELKHLPKSVRRLFDDELMEQLLTLRRDLHQHPELSFKEERTAQRLYDTLAGMRPVSVERVAGTAVVARFKGSRQGGPVVAIRGDIDALPIEEATGLPYASENPGVMHACGHDVHATWAVGAAALLAKDPAVGDVVIILQPAEEIGKGAQAVIESGALEGVSAIFGGHVDRRFDIGTVVAQAGPLAASADSFWITLHGRGAHGARPHESADPVVGLGALIGALQTIVSRRLNPAEAGVVTVGTLEAGSAPNVIPPSASLSGTIRATTAETRALLHEEVRRLAEQIATAYGLRAEVSIEMGTPPIVNPEAPVVWTREAISGVLGDDAIVPLGFLNMGGEDFAYYLEKVPGCFLRIGAREKGGEAIPAHSPQFYAIDETVFVGAAVLAAMAREASVALAT